jgi:D-alanyl-D-alanine carboxypeptidase/D-alanyl-D-alanine-endopeptidase (penicillin-binding protein 4)
LAPTLVAGCASPGRVAASREPVPAVPVAAVTVSEPATERLAIERLRATADSIVASPAFRNARWGILLVDPARGDTLLSVDPDRLFMPASNQKLLTGAAALLTLGPAHRWRTPVLLEGRQYGATFVGDVIVVGSGDPSWSDSLQAGDATQAFAPVASALAARGVRTVRGSVRIERGAFSGPITGYGWELDDLDEPYGAPVDAVLLNEGLMRVVVVAGATPRAPVAVRTPATGRYPARTVEVTVAPRRAASDARTASDPVTVRWDSTGTRLVVRGTLAAGDSVVRTVSYRRPADAVRAALVERLRASGITVTSPTPAPARRAPAAPIRVERAAGRGDTLVVLESAPLGDVLRRMQKPSQNQVAELLFRTVGVVRTGSGAPDSAQAAMERLLDSLGVDARSAAVRDGSGMSRHNYVTPRAVLRVLDVMRRSAVSTAWLAALPVAGVDGTLASRMRGTAAEGTVVAKTGSLDKTRSLSGYVTARDGTTLLFAMLCNNYTVSNREIERVHELLLTAAVELPLASGTSRDR